MELSKELKFEIWKGFGHDNEFSEIIYDIIERMEDGKGDDFYQAIEDGLIYTEDQWVVLKHYFKPTNETLSWVTAMEYFVSDLTEVLALINR